jgi:hypothetical protein
MFIVPTPIVEPTQLDSMYNENTLNKNAIRQITNINKAPMPTIICYGDIPPDYECELSQYIDTPPKYENPLSIGSITKNVSNKETIKSKSNPKKTEDSISYRKGKCCYSTESHESRCCGACYWLCHPNPEKDRCECCPNTFCDYWKSGYIQTTQGSVNDEDRCSECECDDCCCTLFCFPLKFPIFFPCFLGSVFNGCMNKICGTERNYWF